MSLIAKNINSVNIQDLQKAVSDQTYKLSILSSENQNENVPEFAQITEQNVSITYDETSHRYKFQILTIFPYPENKIYVYQVWKKNNDLMNGSRDFYYQSLRDWIGSFQVIKSEYNYLPTTLIEINENYYQAVLVDANVNEGSVLYFETKNIINLSNKVIDEIPKNGTFNNVSFNIVSMINDFNLSPPKKFWGRWGGGFFGLIYVWNNIVYSSDFNGHNICDYFYPIGNDGDYITHMIIKNKNKDKPKDDYYFRFLNNGNEAYECDINGNIIQSNRLYRQES